MHPYFRQHGVNVHKADTIIHPVNVNRNHIRFQQVSNVSIQVAAEIHMRDPREWIGIMALNHYRICCILSHFAFHEK